MKQKLRMICIASAILFNLLVLVTATVAWFVTSKKLDTSNMVVQFEANELNLHYNIYKYNDDSKTYQKFEQPSEFHLNAYDAFIDEKNFNTAVIIEAILTGSLLEDKLTSDVSISLSCSEADTSADVLSNITHFQFKSFTLSSNDIEQIYTQAQDTLSTETKYTFKNVTTTLKFNTIDLTISQAQIIDNTIHIYGLMDYNKALVDLMEIDIDDIPTFTNDLDYIRYNVHD